MSLQKGAATATEDSELLLALLFSLSREKVEAQQPRKEARSSSIKSLLIVSARDFCTSSVCVLEKHKTYVQCTLHYRTWDYWPGLIIGPNEHGTEVYTAEFAG